MKRHVERQSGSISARPLVADRLLAVFCYSSSHASVR